MALAGAGKRVALKPKCQCWHFLVLLRLRVSLGYPLDPDCYVPDLHRRSTKSEVHNVDCATAMYKVLR